MASELTITVCYARPEAVWQHEVRLPAGATVGAALAASGFAQAFPGLDVEAQGVGVFGVRRSLDTVLSDGDRVEVYRALSFDPKESRRRRDEHRRARLARSGGRARPAGLL